MLKFSPTAFYQVPLGCFVMVFFVVGGWRFVCLFVCGIFVLVGGGGCLSFFPNIYFCYSVISHKGRETLCKAQKR